MAVNKGNYRQLIAELAEKNVTLVAVSKTKPVEDILELYNLGHRDFGENYVQEMVDKAALLPSDIRWHFIGHLQSNKVKAIAPFVHLIHGADSLKLLKEINKQGQKNNRIVDCLLQVHIAREETKFGLDDNELLQLVNQLKQEPLPQVRICGLMGMASFTHNWEQVRDEFRHLRKNFDILRSQYPAMKILSMGMSSDYKIAIEEGSTMVRIGSLVFGERVK
jgi:hypothetical protein